MTNVEKNLKMASILREAAEILDSETQALNEAEAAKGRKETKKTIKSMKADEAVKALLKGELEADEAKKIYDQAMKDIADLEKKVSEIPAETFGEKFASLWQHQWTGSAYVKYLIAGVVVGIASYGIGAGFGAIAAKVGKVGTLMAVAMGASEAIGVGTTVGIFNSERKTKDGEKNWNKAQVEKYVDRIKKKIQTAYNKHYGSQNESVDLESLLECSYEEFLKFVPAEDDEA